jgi:regulator of protease activity HflC (stomatin/prohibitin superfamily)
MATKNPWEGNQANKSEDDMGKKIVRGVLTAVIAIILIVVAFSLFYTIESGQEGVILTWGQANPVSVQPGLHMKWPIAQSVLKFDMRTQKFGVSSLGGGGNGGALESAASSDLQIVSVELAVNYKLQDGMAPTIFTKIGPGYEDTVIQPAVHEVTKAEIAQFNAVDLINKREEVRAGIENMLKEKLQQYNINVQSVSIVNFDFSKQFNDAIESKVTAEQLKQKADNDLQRIKVEADQVRAAANGQADAKVALAQAEATQVRLVQEQLKQSPQYIQYIQANKWNGVLPGIFLGGGSGTSSIVPFLNVPTSGTSSFPASTTQYITYPNVTV